MHIQADRPRLQGMAGREMNREERANDAAKLNGRRFIPQNLKDDEMHVTEICPKHGPMNWWGRNGEQNWFCTRCQDEQIKKDS